MGIARADLQQHIIRPSLRALNLWSPAAENLLLATCAHESLGGFYLKQRQGSALGIFQIEPATHADIWQNYLSTRPMLTQKINALTVAKDNLAAKMQELITNLAYATAIARLVYLRIPETLPDADDMNAQAAYWKRYYNTQQGKGRIEDFINHAQGSFPCP